MTQHQEILEYLERKGSITPMQAFHTYGITKLATRISEMKKKGYVFEDEWITNKTQENEYINGEWKVTTKTVRYKKYRLTQ